MLNWRERSLKMLAALLAIVCGVAMAVKTPQQVWDTFKGNQAYAVKLPLSRGETDAYLSGAGTKPAESNGQIGGMWVESKAAVATGKSNGGSREAHRALVSVTYDKDKNTYSPKIDTTTFETAVDLGYEFYTVDAARSKKLVDAVVKHMNDVAKL